ncbi:hypothetical protein TI39_contig279g00051 [Zymoseptoria brevis]|uniref:F-box domain-containing protein n=1 Tax=Zymoseptoria brevis TaxID=1047168 RepID=A0A0F4GXK5_9PEZI|nr:hypothetical protein TI39_contig279g00051 [Zymoseptoria brevis]
MTSLSSLPVELIARIGDSTDPFSHLDLACTCHYVADALKDLFKRHRAAYSQAPCSDVQPLTIPRTLRRAVADPFFAYHIRTLHIWCARSQWADWRPVRLSAPSDAPEDIFVRGANSVAWSFLPDEIDEYPELLASYVSDFEHGSELREQARKELSRGDDGLMKALLLILCPRLRTVYYALSSYVEASQEQDRDGGVGNSSLTWLARIIMAHRDQELGRWPPGLKTLRHLAIGVETGTELLGRHDRHYPPFFVTKILNLPNLESFYLRGMSTDRRYCEVHEAFPLTPGCSSLRHLYLADFWRIEPST